MSCAACASRGFTSSSPLYAAGPAQQGRVFGYGSLRRPGMLQALKAVAQAFGEQNHARSPCLTTRRPVMTPDPGQMHGHGHPDLLQARVIAAGRRWTPHGAHQALRVRTTVGGRLGCASRLEDHTAYVRSVVGTSSGFSGS